MKCSSCGIDVGAAPRNRAVRCLTCGTLLNTAPSDDQAAPATAVPRHSYSTPFGKLLAQVKKSEHWMAVTYVAVPEAKKAPAAHLIGNLLTSWRDLNQPSLAKLHSFDDKDLRCTWILPKVVDAAPLTASASLNPAQVKSLIRTLAAQLDQLHRAGLGAFDLSPSVIFLTACAEQASFVPTPWLASQALWSPGKVKDMPFVAPELDQSQQIYPDPVRADLYAMGALAWFLLTGGDRRKSPTTLPSEHSPELASWDPFIDGCCRSNPARRFDSVAAALKVLEVGQHSHPESLASRGPVAEATTAAQNLVLLGTQKESAVPPSSTHKSSLPWSRRQKVWAAGLAIVAVLALGIYLRRDQVASVFPSIGGVLVPYERGFGDTVLRYADRSYENSSWKKLKESDSLGAMVNDGNGEIRLSRVIGWDDDSYWVAGEMLRDAVLFRCQNGHWSSQGRLKECARPLIRLVDRDTCLVAPGDHGGRAYEMSLRGISDHGKVGECFAICAIAPDLFYFVYLYNPGVLKVANGTRTEMTEDKYKEMLVHREDNTPLTGYRVYYVRHVRPIGQGKALAIAQPMFGNPKAVAFRGGYWYSFADLPDSAINDAWFVCNGNDPQSVVIVGNKGHVHVHTINGPRLDQPITLGVETTSGWLIKVWGVSPEKFWVMDTSGTIWERKGTEWRVVVRGLHRDDVHFVDAWVSPRGTVIAVTEKHVYRLE